jgi:nitrous oxide reductase accessory protein NosL
MRHGIEMRARALAGIVLAALLAACGGDGSAQASHRCDLCGMRVDEGSRWRAGGRAADGRELHFDAPKCAFRRHLERGELRDLWVIEYYSQERRPARELFYVLGTDLESPMGRDLVPVAGREAAERLMRDHHGERVLAFDEVDREVVASLFAPRTAR